MLRTTTALLTVATVFASASAFAQQDVLESSTLDTATQTVTRMETPAAYEATRLGNAVTAYNQTATPGSINHHVIDAADIQNRPATAETRELAYAIRAYNGRLQPAGDTADYSNMPNNQAVALAREVKRFNRTGGSLDVISNHEESAIQ